MKRINPRVILTGVLLVFLSIACNLSLEGLPSNDAALNKQTLFEGITYRQDVRRSPRLMVIHIVEITLNTEGLSFLVTPGDAGRERPLEARTTSRFLDEFNLQLAINGDGFTPWRSNNILNYYPKSGDGVAPIGLAASKGIVYSRQTDNEPTLYLAKNNRATINSPSGKIYNAISGNRLIVQRGKVLPIQDEDAQPRTAIGLDQRRRKLIIVVVDGRQPGYSEGASLSDLAQILIEYGAYTAINLDGGGSSTLVIQDANGKPRLLNRPIDLNIPGRERNVGNHLGVYAKSPVP